MINTYDWKSVNELPVIEELPDPFIKPDGTRLSSPDEWAAQREYLKNMLAHYMYGPMLPTPGNTVGKVVETEALYEGKAIRERVNIKCGPSHGVSFDVYIIRPNREGRFPVITWNCFKDMTPSPVEQEAVCEREYCIAMFEKEQLAVDKPVYEGGVYSVYPDYRWKAIAVWAWGHMRVMDYLETTDYADLKRVIATGHSRGGKAALCAAIYDERFALAAPNASGCGGMGCFRFLGGRSGLSQDPVITESLGSITHVFPHWFADELTSFGSPEKPHPIKNENRLPFDLHFAKALIAPRPLLSTEGLDDEWANTYGTQITWRAADEVYAFLGAEGKNVIHYRDGVHEFNKIDWTVLLDFADHMLKGSNKGYTYPINNLYFPDAPRHYSWKAPYDKSNR